MDAPDAGRPADQHAEPWVLIVDDDPDHRRLARDAIDRAEAQLGVREAADLEEAFDELAGPPAPSLVLLDLDLGGASGLELLERLRGDSPLAPVPVIVCSSRGDEDAREASRDAGADGYLRKPVGFDRMRSRIQTLVDRWVPRTGDEAA